MKAILFKYDADPDSPELYDSSANHCDLMDPDFVTNKQPVWSICGPYVRQSLKPGDILFFLPQKHCLTSAGMGPNYLCSGVLVVSDIIKEGGKSLKDKRISEPYRRKYVWSFNKHVKGFNGEPGDEQRAPYTARIRSSNIILGSREKSEWLGRKGPQMAAIYRRLGLPVQRLAFERIPYVKIEEQAQALYEEVLGRKLE